MMFDVNHCGRDVCGFSTSTVSQQALKCVEVWAVGRRLHCHLVRAGVHPVPVSCSSRLLFSGETPRLGCDNGDAASTPSVQQLAQPSSPSSPHERRKLMRNSLTDFTSRRIRWILLRKPICILLIYSWTTTN